MAFRIIGIIEIIIGIFGVVSAIRGKMSRASAVIALGIFLVGVGTLWHSARFHMTLVNIAMMIVFLGVGMSLARVLQHFRRKRR
ncbi:MAG: hypothetical protein OWS74_08905 [Firmicutes bacterium]|nr:hypothetical protein [Bacillota bacterium]